MSDGPPPQNGRNDQPMSREKMRCESFGNDAIDNLDPAPATATGLRGGNMVTARRKLLEPRSWSHRIVEMADTSRIIGKPSKYQLFGDLMPDEYEGLKASIADHGVEVPILVDQEGQIVDGHQRQRACDELGIACPRVIRQFGSEAEKFETAILLNAKRRQLTRPQKRALIAVYLCKDPQIADNHLAELIGGISKNTVADVRAELESTCQIDKFETHRGKDGKNRKVKYARVFANSDKEANVAMALLPDLAPKRPGEILDLRTAQRRVNRIRKQSNDLRVIQGRVRLTEEMERGKVLPNPDSPEVTMRLSRQWAMPSHETFTVKPIAELLRRYITASDTVVDPFARNSDLATWTNDLNPQTTAQYHMHAEDFCGMLSRQGVVADVVLCDPPYSAHQAKLCYQGIGSRLSQREAQVLFAGVKDSLNRLLRPNGIAISFGWNSSAFGLRRGFQTLEILLVCHGRSHNDTIVVVERKRSVPVS